MTPLLDKSAANQGGNLLRQQDIQNLRTTNLQDQN
jgi:hypothetical protein